MVHCISAAIVAMWSSVHWIGVADHLLKLVRSPATVEHQDRHHAVVLTELFPDTLLDRSPGIVIEVNVC